MEAESVLDIWSAILLGILEGLTEFIPVSSTGHLILLGDFLSFTGPQADTFSIFIQLGAILAVVWLYAERFKKFLKVSNFKESDFQSECLKLATACFPVLVAGVLFHSTIKSVLFAPRPVAIALIVGGVLLILVELKKNKSDTQSIDEITTKQALAIGLFQCLALWPGMSRSGSCIIGGRLFGLKNIVAAEFSFIIAVPVMFAAVSYDLFKSFNNLALDNISIFAVGFIVAGFTAVFAIKFFLRLLERLSLAPFGIYRIALGLLVLILL